MLIKKLILSFIALAIGLGMSAMPAAAATSISRTGNDLGDLFLLNKLFGGSSKVLDKSSDTSLGNLIILDQLFPKTTTATTVTTPTTGAVTTTAVRSFAEIQRGKILLQVQDKGQAWYVNPLTNRRVFLGPTPAEAFNEIASLALGVSNATFDSYAGKAPSNLSGRFLLKVEDSGRLFYVNPADLSLVEVIGPTGALNLIQTVGVGITNTNLNRISQ
ncbi:MAG: hypothetical protein UT48_C0001G0026 [Parcubacteria group bacterium GW2011_GWE2_39_37]|uniref:Uncharacterized protein n=1 Tax=Candidatus Falkowbacteria bacterium GW2011_GWF2_39_8 TaxID=1618642 RepID=A0A0G0SET3_9BACT|nr:MAG: hypothetical protein UT48_C0001G0026 [Parcubacteria group bacterium GW2011_GWE2_39_37]KKR33225.1 MAG: hypothetical protein UT64_C0012G0017 [Candidatus Falkowbacteria bacterium GW2011_GWF2_39_8]